MWSVINLESAIDSNRIREVSAVFWLFKDVLRYYIGTYNKISQLKYQFTYLDTKNYDKTRLQLDNINKIVTVTLVLIL